MPFTTPLTEPTVAIAVLLLDQVPLGDVLVSVTEDPIATYEAPAIEAGFAFTVIDVVL
jgi:hypothetical protein